MSELEVSSWEKEREGGKYRPACPSVQSVQQEPLPLRLPRHQLLQIQHPASSKTLAPTIPPIDLPSPTLLSSLGSSTSSQTRSPLNPTPSTQPTSPTPTTWPAKVLASLQTLTVFFRPYPLVLYSLRRSATSRSSSPLLDARTLRPPGSRRPSRPPPRPRTPRSPSSRSDALDTSTLSRSPTLRRLRSLSSPFLPVRPPLPSHLPPSSCLLT